jgi:hypothetical protein
MRGRIMGSQGLVNGMGHLVGGSEIGAIANATSISWAIGLNAGLGLVLILLVAALSPLVRRQIDTNFAEDRSTPTAPPDPQQLPAEESSD